MDKAVNIGGKPKLEGISRVSMTKWRHENVQFGTLDDGHCCGVKCRREVARTTPQPSDRMQGDLGYYCLF